MDTCAQKRPKNFWQFSEKPQKFNKKWTKKSLKNPEKVPKNPEKIPKKGAKIFKFARIPYIIKISYFSIRYEKIMDALLPFPCAGTERIVLQRWSFYSLKLCKTPYHLPNFLRLGVDYTWSHPLPMLV